MPRTIFDKPAHSKLYILINGATADLSCKEKSALIGVTSGTTAKKYLDNPEKLPLEKLIKICRKQRVPLEELRQAIQY